MTQENPPNGHAAEPHVETPSQDPWRAFAYVVSGVAVYGFAGWGLDQWWNTDYMVAIGIVAGAALGIYLTWKAFNVPPIPADNDKFLDK